MLPSSSDGSAISLDPFWKPDNGQKVFSEGILINMKLISPFCRLGLFHPLRDHSIVLFLPCVEIISWANFPQQTWNIQRRYQCLQNHNGKGRSDCSGWKQGCHHYWISRDWKALMTDLARCWDLWAVQTRQTLVSQAFMIYWSIHRKTGYTILEITNDFSIWTGENSEQRTWGIWSDKKKKQKTKQEFPSWRSG